jgi:SRSO17 transposase
MISPHNLADHDGEFNRFVAHLSRSLDHLNRHAGLSAYLAGLMPAMAIQSAQAMAEHPDPARAQALNHFVAKSNWDDLAMRAGVLEWVLPHLELADNRYWVIDEIVTPKKGLHSVGVAYQPTGPEGIFGHCQVAIGLSMAGNQGSMALAHQLYLPREWVDQPMRMKQVGVPETFCYSAKSDIALALLQQASKARLLSGMLLADARFGDIPAFRNGIIALDMRYAMGIGPKTRVRLPTAAPSTPLPDIAFGLSPAASSATFKPGGAYVTVQTLAEELPKRLWQTLSRRDGAGSLQRSSFARVRVRPFDSGGTSTAVNTDACLLMEQPEAANTPTRFCLTNADASLSLEQMVTDCKMGLHTKLEYEEMKKSMGLHHYEGRGWRGFHHHATLCMAAHGFLLVQRLKHTQHGA